MLIGNDQQLKHLIVSFENTEKSKEDEKCGKQEGTDFVVEVCWEETCGEEGVGETERLDRVTNKCDGEVVVGRMKGDVQRKNRQATSKDSNMVNGFHLYYRDLAVSGMFPYTVILFV